MQPELVVCLGAVAVTALLGTSAKVTTHRGKIVESPYGARLVTTHPSSILRVNDSDEREAAYGLFLSDLRAGLKYLQRSAA